MDATISWRINNNAEDLVAAILELKNELQNACIEKHGKQSEFIRCNVYANKKNLDLLRKSELWVDDETPKDIIFDKRSNVIASTLVANFTLFKLHNSRIMGDDQIRVVSAFDVGHVAEQVWFGNVECVVSDLL